MALKSLLFILYFGADILLQGDPKILSLVICLCHIEKRLNKTNKKIYKTKVTCADLLKFDCD